MPPPTSDRPRSYNKNERELMDKFKEEYMKTTTPAERKMIAQVRIFPALFTYWSSIGVDLSTKEMDRRSDVSKSLKTCLNC